MAKHIDADRLRSEIKRRIDATINIHHIPCHRREELEGLLAFIDSLQRQEQPEVDLEKEIELAMPQPYSFLEVGVFNAESVYSKEQMVATARHFYELGLNARKEE